MWLPGREFVYLRVVNNEVTTLKIKVMLYLKVDNGDKMELIFKSDDKSEMNHYENKAIALWGVDNVMVTKNK